MTNYGPIDIQATAESLGYSGVNDMDLCLEALSANMSPTDWLIFLANDLFA